MCSIKETMEKKEHGELVDDACKWFEELTDLENRSADALVRMKVIKAALEGIAADRVHDGELYDMLMGCVFILGESIDRLGYK